MNGWAYLSHALLWQQRDPVGFLLAQQRYPRRLWRPAWRVRIVSMMLALGILCGVATFTRQPLRLILGAAITIWLVLQMICAGIPISVLGEPQFWLLYAYAPAASGIALLGGLSRVFPDAAFGLFSCATFGYCGKLVADATAIWIWQRTQAVEKEWNRQRAGGVRADLPRLTFQSRLRALRWGGALLLVASAWYLLESSLLPLPFLLTLLIGPCVCLQLDATLWAALTARPPVRYNPATAQWQASYSGRTALWLPARSWRALFQSHLTLTEQSAALLAALTQGNAGASLRRALAQAPPAHCHALLLRLSLQPGGGAACAYLSSQLTPELRNAGHCYAALAAEAAKPAALRRWLHALSAPNSEMPRQPLLQQLYQALLDFSPQRAAAAGAVHTLSQLLREIYALPTDKAHIEATQLALLPASWPVALLSFLLEQNPNEGPNHACNIHTRI